MTSQLRIAITLPYLFSVRDFLFTPAWSEMARRRDAHFFLLASDEGLGAVISARKCPNISFVRYPPSPKRRPSVIERVMRKDLAACVWLGLLQKLDRGYILDSLVYRYAVLNDLSHYRIRKGRSRKERIRQKIFYDYRKAERAGFPFPRSKVFFRFLYEIHHGFFKTIHKNDTAFLRGLKPDLFVLGRLHYMPAAYWARVSRYLGIPMIGIVSSWDHPTTKGPTPRGMSRYIVASKRMVEEMSDLHGIKKDKICQIGKVQMDIYNDPSIFYDRKDFLRGLGVPPDYRLVTLGTNTTGLKEHEVSIAQKLSNDFVNFRYGKAALLIRTHPQDKDWKRDFLSLSSPPQVICHMACSFGTRAEDNLSYCDDDMIMLANMMKHSDVVIQSRGSLALDSIAFDTPVISLAFDGDLERKPEDSFLHEYEFEHYKPLITAQGTWMVGSYDKLDQAILEYLKEPAIHGKGRRIIREEHIEPLDGKASKRLIDCIVDSAKMAREKKLPEGDWDHTGLGNLRWSARQIYNIHDYV